MRKIALLSVALLLFAVLATVYIVRPLDADTAGPGQSINRAAPPENATTMSPGDTRPRPIGLRLDTRLANLPQTESIPLARTARSFALLRQPDHRRSLLFLGGALGLGLLTGWLLKQRPAVRSSYFGGQADTASTRVSPAIDADTSVQLVDTAIAEHVAQANDFQEEILALRDSIESYEIAQQHNEQRLRDHQATIEELRDELRNADELTHSLNSSQKKEQLLSREIEERDEVINNLHSDIDNWREEWAARDQHIEQLELQTVQLSTELNQSREEGKALGASVDELQRTREALAAEVELLRPNIALAEDFKRQLQELDDRHNNIKSEKQAVEAALVNATEQVQQLAELQKTLGAVQDQLEESHQEINTGQVQLMDLQASYDELLRLKAHDDEKFSQLNAAHSEQSAALDDQRLELEESQSACDRYQQELDALQETLETAKSDGNIHSANLLELKGFLDQANADLAHLEQDLEKAHIEVARETAEKAKLSDQKQQLQEQLERLDADLGETSEMLVLTEQSLAKTQTELAEVTTEKTELSSQQQFLQEQLERLDADLGEAREMLVLTEQNLAKTQIELAEETSEKSELSIQQGLLQEQLERLGADLGETRENLARAEQDLEAAQTELASETTEKSELLTQQQVLQEQLEQLGVDLEDARATIVRTEQDFENAQAELASETVEKTELSVQQQLLQEQLEQLRDDFEVARTSLERADQNFENAQSMLASEKAEKDNIQNQKQILQEQFEQLSHDHWETRVFNDELNDSIDLLREDLAQMVNKLHQENSKISSMRHELEQTQTMLTARECEVIELVAEVKKQHNTALMMQAKIEAADATELRLSNWDNSLQTYQHDLVKKNRLIDELRDELTVTSHTGTLLKQQIRTMDEQLETLLTVQIEAAEIAQESARLNLDIEQQNTVIDDMSNWNRQHDEHIETFRKDLLALQDERLRWQQHIQGASLAVQNLQDELEDSYTVLARLDELMAEEFRHETYSSRHESWDNGTVINRLQIITQQADFLRNSLGAATTENQTLMSTLDDMQDLEKHLQLLQQELAEHQHDLQQQIEARREQEQRCAEYRQDIITLEAQIADKQSQINASIAAEQGASELLESQHRKLSTAQVQLEAAGDNLAVQGQEIIRLQEYISALQTEQQEYAERVKSNVQSLRANFDRQRNDLDEHYLSTSSQLKGELSDLKDVNQSLRGIIHQQREKLVNLERVAEPLPVLRTKIAEGRHPDNIPVLGNAGNQAVVDTSITTPVEAGHADQPAPEVPVLRQSLNPKEEQT